MNAYGYQQYKAQSVNTMTKGEMLILLFDEAVKSLTKAELELKAEKFDKFENSVMKARDIVQYLSDTLDRKYPISNNLLQLYEYFNYQMIRAVSGRNVEVLKEVKGMLQDLGNTFKEADKMSR